MISLILKILLIIAIVIISLCFILFIFTIVPIKYVFNFSFKNGILDLYFKFLFFRFTMFLKLGLPISYKATIMNKIIADSSNKKNSNDNNVDDDGSSMSDSDFINDKSVENEINFSEFATKEFIERANEYKKELEEKAKKREEKKIEIEKEIDEIEDETGKVAFKFIDAFKKFLPLDIIDAAKLILREWIRYGKFILPKKCDLNTEFGLDDPYTVGIVLSYLAPLYAMYGNSINIRPYFDKNVFICELYAVGKPQIIFMLVPIMNLFFNKRFREILKKGKENKKN